MSIPPASIRSGRTRRRSLTAPENVSLLAKADQLSGPGIEDKVLTVGE
jgi:hypothetical protein